MLDFFKRRIGGRKSPASLALGPLESTVMEVLWTRGQSNVHEVAHQLERPLAYTTVMTTLDRLYKKGFLTRSKLERAFVYSPRWSRREWEQKRAGAFVSGFLDRPQASGELLISCLVDAVGQHDEALLHELERKIKAKRKALERGRKS